MTDKNFFPVPLDSGWSYASFFGPRKQPTAGASTYHKGIDIKVPVGTPIIAVKSGKIEYAGWQNANDTKIGYGQYIKVKNDDGTVSYYGHLNEIDIKDGRIEAGQQLGKSGNTGASSGPHLHYGEKEDGKWINPKESLDSILKNSPSINFDPNSQGGSIENTYTDIALQSISDDLYSIHEKLFSTENLAYAAAQLAMGANVNDVAKSVLVNTIATSAVDASLKAMLLRKEFADKSLNGLNKSYDDYMEKNPEFSSLKAGFTIFITTAVLTGDYREAAKNASIQALANYVSRNAVEELAKNASSQAAADSVGKYAGPIATAVTIIINGIANGASAQEIAIQTAIAISSTMIGAAVSGVVMGTKIGAAIGSIIPGLGTIIGAIVGSFVGYALSKLFGLIPPPPPPPLFIIEAKEDGSGNIIYSLHEGYSIILKAIANDDAVGSKGSETLAGNSGNNSLYGLGGNDYLPGREGNDNLFAGDGNDEVNAGEGDDFVDGDDGNDFIQGGAGNDTIAGGNGDDRIYGDLKDSQESQFITAGDDKIDAGSGNDYVEAGGGDDVVTGGAGNDQILGGDGKDTIDGSFGDDVINGDAGDDVLSGGQDGVLIHPDKVIQYKQDFAQLEPKISEIQATYNVALIDLNNYVASLNKFLEIISPVYNYYYGNNPNSDVLRQAKQSVIDSDFWRLKAILGVSYNYDYYSKGSEIFDTARSRLEEYSNELKLFFELSDEELKAKQDLINSSKYDLDRFEVIKTFLNNNEIGRDGFSENLAKIIQYKQDFIGLEHQISETQAKYEAALADLNNYTEKHLYSYGKKQKLFIGSNEIRNAKQAVVDSNKAILDQLETIKAFLETSGNDAISGGDGNDKIFGFSGNDILNGDAGDDIIVGGYGSDIIDGGTGNDTIIADDDEQSYFDALSGTDLLPSELNSLFVNDNDVIDAGDGDDFVSLIEGDDSVNLGSGNDILQNQYADAIIHGGSGDDEISSIAGNNIVFGEEGNDKIALGFGDDIVDGGLGDDKIDVGDGVNKVDGGAGDDLILSGINNDEITGGDGNDIIQDQGGNNILDGGAGDDYVIADEGDDIISTGEGNNDSVFAGGGNDVIISQATNANLIGAIGNDIYKIEKLTGNIVIEDSGNASDIDTIEFSYKKLANLKLSKNGDDLVIRFTDSSSSVTIKNNFAIANNLEGKNSKIELLKFGEVLINIGSVIFGTTGNDTINGTINDDLIIGDLGKDIIFGGSGNDVIDGSEGDDLIYGEDGDDIMKGSEENDIIYGGNGSDRLIGNEGNDILEGGAGNDIFVIAKPSDEDVITDFTVGSDKLDLTGYSQFSSLKTLQYFSNGITQNGLDTIVDLDGSTKVTLQNQTIAAVNQNQNFIFDIKASAKATDGNDILSGTSGNDTITDGKGSDIMTGGSGNDIFSITKNAGDIDTITDFNPYDVITITTYYTRRAWFFSWEEKTEEKISSFDKIDLRNFDNYVDILQLDISQKNSDTVISLDDGQKILLENVRADNLFAKNFQFAVFEGMPQIQRYSGTVAYNFALDNVVEVKQYDNGFICLTNYNKKSYDSSNFWNSKNIWNEGASRSETNNEEYVTGGKWECYKRELRRYTTFNGDGGNDRMYGAWWDETINAGSGNDEVYAGSGNDYVNGGTGNDYVDGGTGDDRIHGDDGNDALYGGDGNDYLIGLNGNDYLNGGAGNDTLRGWDDSDMLFDSEGNNFFDGGFGDDYITAGAGNDEIHGGDGNDYIIAGAGNDNIDGGRGGGSRLDRDQDYIEAGSGNDIVNDNYGDNFVYLEDGDDRAILGVGNDYIDGGAGNDYIEGGAGNDVIYDDSGNNWLHGGAGADNIQGGVDADIIYGGSGEDLIYGNGGSDLIIAGTNNDIVYGGDAGDDISLGQGDDTGYGDEGDDLIKGEDGNDTIYGGNGRDSISGGADNDKIYGGAGNDIIAGDAGDDIIYGDDGSDIINGGDGNDTIYGGNGNNLLRGGSGSDRFVFDKNKRFRDLIDGFEAGDKIDISSYNQYTSILQIKRNTSNVINSSIIKLYDGNQITIKSSYISNLSESQLILNNYNSSVLETELNPNSQTNYINTAGYLKSTASNSVNNSNWFTDRKLSVELKSPNIRSFTISSEIYNSFSQTFYNNNTGWCCDIYGNNGYINARGGDDFIYSYQYSVIGRGHVIYCGDGNDFASGTGINDLIYGENDNDRLYGGDGNDIIVGGLGDDQIHGDSGNDYVIGDDGNDSLYGEDGEDIIEGNNGNDYIESGLGNDFVYGGLGGDTIYLNDGNDFASGGGGRDYIDGGSGDDKIYGDGGHDKLNGGSGNDVIYGGDENDIICGNDCNDSLFGDEGSDLIYDGAGNDNIFGGNGDDIIYAGSGSDVISGGLGRDIFSFESLLSSTNLNLDLITDFTVGEDAIDLSNIGIASFASINVSNDGIDTIISDQNSSFAVKLSGVHLLTANDFIMNG